MDSLSRLVADLDQKPRPEPKTRHICADCRQPAEKVFVLGLRAKPWEGKIGSAAFPKTCGACGGKIVKVRS